MLPKQSLVMGRFELTDFVWRVPLKQIWVPIVAAEE